MSIPVFYGATHPAVLGRRHVPWETNVTVACGGVTIQPGDIIAGDADGVIVIPRDIALAVAEDAAEQERQEEFIVERVAGGESIDGLYPLGPKWRPAYDQWRKERDST
jgi:regulator of RNase E activity RraA